MRSRKKFQNPSKAEWALAKDHYEKYWRRARNNLKLERYTAEDWAWAGLTLEECLTKES